MNRLHIAPTDGAADESPWHFGGDYSYPALHCGAIDAVAQRTNYDQNGNDPIDIATLAATLPSGKASCRDATLGA